MADQPSHIKRESSFPDDEVTDKERIEDIEREDDEGEATFVAAAYPCLEIISGPREGARIHLAAGETSIGRSSENIIVFRDSSVSRRHAFLYREEGNFRIKDLGGRNGVIVNGVRLASHGECVLSHLDRIALGIYRLRLLVEEPALAADVDDEALAEAEARAAQAEAAQVEESVQDIVPPSEDKAPPPVLQGPAPSAEVVQTSDEASAVAVRGEAGLPAAPEGEEEITDGGLARATRWKIVATGAAILLLIGLALGAWLYHRGKVAHETPSVSPFTPSNPQPGSLATSEPHLGANSGGFNAVTVPLQESAQKVASIFINVDSEPLPATILFDDKELGKTPLHTNIDAEIGKAYTLKARYKLEDIGETFETETPFTVNPGDDTLQFKLSAELATVKFSQLPPEVTAYLDASYAYDLYHSHSIKLETIGYGKPLYVPYGNYALELRGVSPARPPTSLGVEQEDILYRRSFVLNKDHPLEGITIPENALKIFPAQITSDPAKADILYDGKKIGVTPWEGDLALGKHTLLLQKQGFKDSKREVEIWRNEIQTIAVTLETTAAGELIFQAKEAFAVEAYAKSVDLLSAALNKSPTPKERAQAYFLLAESYKGQGNCEKATNYYTQAKDSDEWRNPSMLGLATCAHRVGEETQAILYLSHVLLSSKDESLLTQAESLFHKVSPLRSVLYLNTKPAGAAVLVNKRPVDNQTPLILTDLGVGSYKINIRLTGYEDEDMDLYLKLSEFKPIYLELKPLQ